MSTKLTHGHVLVMMRPLRLLARMPFRERVHALMDAGFDPFSAPRCTDASGEPVPEDPAIALFRTAATYAFLAALRENEELGNEVDRDLDMLARQQVALAQRAAVALGIRLPAGLFPQRAAAFTVH